jgi:hypothetical protein
MWTMDDGIDWGLTPNLSTRALWQPPVLLTCEEKTYLMVTYSVDLDRQLIRAENISLYQ